MANKDFLVNEDGTPIILNGDFVIDLSDEQHIQDNLLASPGHYATAPTIGANLMYYKDIDFDDNIRNKMIRDMSISLAKDGYKLLSWDLETSNIKVGLKNEL